MPRFELYSTFSKERLTKIRTIFSKQLSTMGSKIELRSPFERNVKTFESDVRKFHVIPIKNEVLARGTII